MLDDHVRDDDEEQEEDAVEKPHVDEFDVGGDGEFIGCVAE